MRIRIAGFEDIEDIDHDDRPLKKWTSSFYHANSTTPLPAHQPEASPMVSNFPSPVFQTEEGLLNNPEFASVCERICRHRNNSLSPAQIHTIWSRHCAGDSNRTIATDLQSTEASVRRAIVKIISWMDLL